MKHPAQFAIYRSFTIFVAVSVLGFLVAGCDQTPRDDGLRETSQGAPQSLTPIVRPVVPPVVESAAIDLAIEIERLDAPSDGSTTLPRIATGLTLRAGERTYHFADSLSQPPAVEGPDLSGRTVLTIHYTPIEGDGLIGSRLSDITDINELQFELAAALLALGYEFKGLKNIVIIINGRRIYDLPADNFEPLDSSRISVGPQFARIVDQYTATTSSKMQ